MGPAKAEQQHHYQHRGANDANQHRRLRYIKRFWEWIIPRQISWPNKSVQVKNNVMTGNKQKSREEVFQHYLKGSRYPDSPNNKKQSNRLNLL